MCWVLKHRGIPHPNYILLPRYHIPESYDFLHRQFSAHRYPPPEYFRWEQVNFWILLGRLFQVTRYHLLPWHTHSYYRWQRRCAHCHKPASGLRYYRNRTLAAGRSGLQSIQVLNQAILASQRPTKRLLYIYCHLSACYRVSFVLKVSDFETASYLSAKSIFPWIKTNFRAQALYNLWFSNFGWPQSLGFFRNQQCRAC